MNANLNVIIGVEMLCAAQGIEFRAPLKTSPELQKVMARIRADVPAISDDRFMAGDMQTAADLVKTGVLSQASGLKASIDEVRV
jgi:histidine ammonia-lyase